MIELGEPREANNPADESLPPYLRRLVAAALVGVGAAVLGLIPPEQQGNSAHNFTSFHGNIGISNQPDSATNANFLDPLANVTLHN